MLKWFEPKRMAGKLGTSLLIVACALLLSGCHPLQGEKTEKVIRYESNFEIVGKEKDESIGKVRPAIFTSVDRSNKGIKEVEGPVLSKKGVNISLPSGRYMIVGYPAGNVFVYDRNGDLIIREIVGNQAGVSSLTLDIDETYKIFTDGGFDYINAKPQPTILSNVLSAGIWEVGLDIESGVYSVTSPWGLGYLEIHEKGEDPLLYEIIGGDKIRSESRVQLKDGQKLVVRNVMTIQFEPIDETSRD